MCLFHGQFLPFAQIVDFMHCQKVCHRDLKLENFVFVDDRWIEDGGTLKVECCGTQKGLPSHCSVPAVRFDTSSCPLLGCHGSQAYSIASECD